MNIDSIRPFVAWVVGSAVAAFSAWLLEHVHVNIPPEIQEHTKQAIVFATLVVVSKLIAKKTNPGDAASVHLIKAQTAVVNEIKETEKLYKQTADHSKPKDS